MLAGWEGRFCLYPEPVELARESFLYVVLIWVFKGGIRAYKILYYYYNVFCARSLYAIVLAMHRYNRVSVRVLITTGT